MIEANSTGTYWCHRHGRGPCACLAATASWWINGQEVTARTTATLVTPDHLCPDLLRYEQIGPADNLRGRVVKLFFWLMRAWPAA
jgi:hypothetical protein